MKSYNIRFLHLFLEMTTIVYDSNKVYLNSKLTLFIVISST